MAKDDVFYFGKIVKTHGIKGELTLRIDAKDNFDYNDIEYIVTIIDGFDYPNLDKGNFSLAAHSGSGPKALFKDLYKLSVGDMVKISYNGKLYTYKVTNIYTQKKQGYLTIFRNPEKTTLSLITCTKNNKTLQTVYIAELT